MLKRRSLVAALVVGVMAFIGTSFAFAEPVEMKLRLVQQVQSNDELVICESGTYNEVVDEQNVMVAYHTKGVKTTWRSCININTALASVNNGTNNQNRVTPGINTPFRVGWYQF